MSEFKITPEDVGRVAVDEIGVEMEIVYVDEAFAVGKDRGGFAFVYSLTGGHSEIDRLTHWKPRTLEATKKWWPVNRVNETGELRSCAFDKFGDITRPRKGFTRIAVIYDTHWHGCEEGRFDTPESIGEDS